MFFGAFRITFFLSCSTIMLGEIDEASSVYISILFNAIGLCLDIRA
jgi:hypothetical protein